MGETEAFVEEKIFLLGYTLGQWPLQLTASQPHRATSPQMCRPNPRNSEEEQYLDPCISGRFEKPFTQ